MRLAEKCADTFSNLKRNERSKNYYLKQVKILNLTFQEKISRLTKKSILFS